MPSGKLHKTFDKYAFGKTYGEVHRLLDITAFTGPKHRKDQNILLAILASRGNKEETMAGILHVVLDQAVSKLDPKLKRIIDPDSYYARRRRS